MLKSIPKNSATISMAELIKLLLLWKVRVLSGGMIGALIGALLIVNTNKHYQVSTSVEFVGQQNVDKILETLSRFNDLKNLAESGIIHLTASSSVMPNLPGPFTSELITDLGDSFELFASALISSGSSAAYGDDFRRNTTINRDKNTHKQLIIGMRWHSKQPPEDFPATVVGQVNNQITDSINEELQTWKLKIKSLLRRKVNRLEEKLFLQKFVLKASVNSAQFRGSFAPALSSGTDYSKASQKTKSDLEMRISSEGYTLAKSQALLLAEKIKFFSSNIELVEELFLADEISEFAGRPWFIQKGGVSATERQRNIYPVIGIYVIFGFLISFFLSFTLRLLRVKE